MCTERQQKRRLLQCECRGIRETISCEFFSSKSGGRISKNGEKVFKIVYLHSENRIPHQKAAHFDCWTCLESQNWSIIRCILITFLRNITNSHNEHSSRHNISIFCFHFLECFISMEDIGLAAYRSTGELCTSPVDTH